MSIYLDAGTTYSKIISVNNKLISGEVKVKEISNNKLYYYIFPSNEIKKLRLEFTSSCGHMTGMQTHENEIIALAKGSIKYVTPDATVLDLGSRDAKWIRFKNSKFHDMDWNTSCASSTGATVEMLLKFYNLKPEDLTFNPEKYNITCGIFGFEKIMDSISKGCPPEDAVSKFVHGLAYNSWIFAKKPETLYLSGGFCSNECFVNSLKKYCNVVILGRFVLCEGLMNE